MKLKIDFVGSYFFPLKRLFCPVPAKYYLGAKHAFEKRTFKVFYFGQKKQPLEWLLGGQNKKTKNVSNTQEIPHKE